MYIGNSFVYLSLFVQAVIFLIVIVVLVVKRHAHVKYNG